MGKLINLAGQRFGFWVVKSRETNTKSGQVQWLCKCECGKEKTVTSNSLRTGNSTSCGCNHVPDLTNKCFGQLTVTGLSSTKNGRRCWHCKCSCGKELIISTYSLREGHITSCGCNLINLAEEAITISETLLEQCDSTINHSLTLVNRQIKIMAEINKELQINVKLLSELKVARLK